MLASPTGLRNFPVVEQILNEQEANSLWLEADPTVEEEGPQSLVPEEEQPSQAFGQMTDKVSLACGLAADLDMSRSCADYAQPDVIENHANVSSPV